MENDINNKLLSISKGDKIKVTHFYNIDYLCTSYKSSVITVYVDLFSKTVAKSLWYEKIRFRLRLSYCLRYPYFSSMENAFEMVLNDSFIFFSADEAFVTTTFLKYSYTLKTLGDNDGIA